MRRDVQFRPDLAPCEAFAASLRVWLVALLAWFIDAAEAASANATRAHPAKRLLAGIVAVSAPAIRAELREAAYDLRRALFLRAFSRILLPKPRAHVCRPLGAPAGFRPRAAIPNARRILSSARANLHAGTLRQRARLLLHLLDTPEPAIARIVRRLKRLLRHPRRSRLVLTHAPRETMPRGAATRAPCAADTS